MNNEVLAHYGVLGMHWGVRRYQNKDGSLTGAGKRRYKAMKKEVARIDKDLNYESHKTKRLRSAVENANKEAAELRKHGYTEEADAVDFVNNRNRNKLNESMNKDANKRAKKVAKDASKGRFTMSDEELLSRIGRLERQKRFRELTNDETKWGDTEFQRKMVSAGQDVVIGAAKTAVAGTIQVGGKTAISAIPTVNPETRTITTLRNASKPDNYIYVNPTMGAWKVSNTGELYIPSNQEVAKALTTKPKK